MGATSRRLAIAIVVVLVALNSALPAHARSLSVSVATSFSTSSFHGSATIAGADTTKLISVQFTVTPKVGATAAPISATYSAAWLRAAGAVDAVARTVTVPIFGLYAGHDNVVSIRYRERSGSAQLTATISTPSYDGNFSAASRTDVVSRNAAVRLDYSYMLVKHAFGYTPLLIDVDGNVRWAVPGGYSQGSYLWDSYLYYGSGSSLYRMSLDGRSEFLADYSSLGVTGFHHNFDMGKRGLLLEVDTVDHSESTILEVDKQGRVLETFDISAIFRAAMTSDDINAVNGAWIIDRHDWFHNNASTYWKRYDTLVVSSRENFVVGIGFTDKKIKWILGDTTKGWYQSFASLDKFALTLSPGSLPPIGQHAVSITTAGELMLFDNGELSYQQWYLAPGQDRSYSAPRRYKIDPRKMTATETWNYEHGREVNSTICSSVYQDGSSLLIDYAHANGGSRYVGLGRNGVIGFEWVFPGYQCWEGWNAAPIHLESISY